MGTIPPKPFTIDKLDYQYYQIVSEVIESTPLDPEPLGVSRFYIRKRSLFLLERNGTMNSHYNLQVYTPQNTIESQPIQKIIFLHPILYKSDTKMPLSICGV